MSILIPYTQLSPEQQNIIKRVSTTNSNLFVEGPPGAGKTLISLYVLRDIASKQNIRPLLMMYNHSLYGFLITSLKELKINENITIATKDQFFWRLGRQYNIYPDNSDDYDIKYKYILDSLLRKDIAKDYKITLVDEVQDIKPEEWELIKRMSDKVISLGDFDQSIYNTTIAKESIKSYGIYERLRSIFRFHKNIAKLANYFSNSGEDLEEIVRIDSSKQPKLIDTSYNEEFALMADIIKEQRIENKHIGVICPDTKRLRNFSRYLNDQNVKHSYYERNKDLRNHDFTSTDPLLITSYSAKGLEFEKVIVFGFDTTSNAVHYARRDGKLKSAVFVSITRSKSDLFIIRNANTIQEIKNLQEEEIEEGGIDIDDIF